MTENNDKSGNSAFPTLIAPSVDPLRNVQSSENYINSLGKLVNQAFLFLGLKKVVFFFKES